MGTSLHLMLVSALHHTHTALLHLSPLPTIHSYQSRVVGGGRLSKSVARSHNRAPPMPACRYVEKNDSASILATKRLVGVTPEVNLREHVTPTPFPSANEAAQSGFETQRRHHQKPKTRVSAAPQNELMSSKFFF